MLRTMRGFWVAALIFYCPLFLPGESAAQEFLTKPVEFVVHAAATGGVATLWRG